MWLNSETFRTVVASTPLVSIDLVVQNQEGFILLGQRLNRPAQGFWFVPGGRILKNESLDRAFDRLTTVELGRPFQRGQAQLLGVYEHFYSDSVFADRGDGPDTHYVVLVYRIVLSTTETLHPPHTQHDHYRWWTPTEAHLCAEVHDNTRAYLDVLQ